MDNLTCGNIDVSIENPASLFQLMYVCMYVCTDESNVHDQWHIARKNDSYSLVPAVYVTVIGIEAFKLTLSTLFWCVEFQSYLPEQWLWKRRNCYEQKTFRSHMACVVSTFRESLDNGPRLKKWPISDKAISGQDLLRQEMNENFLQQHRRLIPVHSAYSFNQGFGKSKSQYTVTRLLLRIAVHNRVAIRIKFFFTDNFWTSKLGLV